MTVREVPEGIWFLYGENIKDIFTRKGSVLYFMEEIRQEPPTVELREGSSVLAKPGKMVIVWLESILPLERDYVIYPVSQKPFRSILAECKHEFA